MRYHPVLTLVMLFSGALYGSDALLDYAPPDTSFLMGINLGSILQTPAGAAALAEARSSPELTKFIAETGFDPLADIDEVVIAGSGPVAGRANSRSTGAILVRGRFDAAKMERFTNQQFSAETYRGVRIFTRTVGEPFSIAVLNRATAVAGDPERVRGAVRHGAGAGPSSALVAKAAELRSMHVWFAAVAPASALSGDLPQGPGGELAKSIREVNGGMNFSNDVVVVANILTRTSKDAEGIAAMMRMLIGLAASGNRDAKEAAAILEKVSIRTDGENVHLGLTVPSADLRKWAREARAKVAAARQTPSPAQQPTGDVRVLSTSEASTLKVYSSEKDMGVVTLPPK